MKFQIILFLCVFLLLTSCSQVNDNIDSSVEIDNQDQAAENSEDIVEGLDEITENLDDIENIVS